MHKAFKPRMTNRLWEESKEHSRLAGGPPLWGFLAHENESVNSKDNDKSSPIVIERNSIYMDAHRGNGKRDNGEEDECHSRGENDGATHIDDQRIK